MTRLINFIHRSWLLFMVRSLERELHDQREASQQVRSVSDLKRIMISEGETRAELAKCRSQYTALLPIGEINVWPMA